jgi:hypothetical protein
VDFAVELLGLDFIRRKQPGLYHLGQMTGFITENLGLSAGTQRVTFAAIGNFFRAPGGYFAALWNSIKGVSDQTRADLLLLPLAGFLKWFELFGHKTLSDTPVFKTLAGASFDAFYGWDALPVAPNQALPPLENLLEKSLSVAIRRRDPATDCDPNNPGFQTCPPPGTPAKSLEVLLDLIAATSDTGVGTPGLFVSLGLTSRSRSTSRTPAP